MPLRLAFSPVYVDQVSHGLEEIEGDPGRQQDLYGQGLHGQPSRINQRVESFDHRRSQFEDEKNAYKGPNSAKQAAPFGAPVLRFFQTQSQRVGEQGGKKEQKTIGRM